MVSLKLESPAGSFFMSFEYVRARRDDLVYPTARASWRCHHVFGGGSAIGLRVKSDEIRDRVSTFDARCAKSGTRKETVLRYSFG